MATRQEMAAILAYLGAAVGKEPTADQARVYFDMLGDLPANVLEMAAKRALTEHEIATIPPVGMMRRHAAELTGPKRVPLAEAFESARRFASDWYPWLCDGLPTDPKSRARFDAAYNALPDIARRAGKAYGWPALATTEPGVSFAHFRQLAESIIGPEEQEAALPPGARTPALERAISAIGQLPGVNGHG